MEPNWEDFLKIRKPVVCSIKLNAWINHAVVVLNVDAEKGVQIADPLMGLRWCPAERFRADFLNDAVAVYREDPRETNALP